LATFTALLDANVLYSMPVTDIVLELAATGLFRARWTEDIHDEWVRNVAADRPDILSEVVHRRRNKMDEAIPQALVTGYRPLIDKLNLPDANDRHVLAAAIVGRVDVIVTYNIKDFPENVLSPYGIEVQHPDEFLNHQRTLNETLFITCVKTIRDRLSKPKYDAEGYIGNLRKCHLQVVAAELEKVKALI
jgi:PIN domain